MKRRPPYAPDADEALVLDPLKGLKARHMAVLWHIRRPGRVLAGQGRHIATLRELIRLGLVRPRLLAGEEGFAITPAGLVVVRDMAERLNRPGQGRQPRAALAKRLVQQTGGPARYALVTERLAQGDAK